MTHASRLAAQLRLAAKDADDEQAERLEDRAEEIEAEADDQ